MSSTRNPGRFAGLLYLLGSIPGFFALLYPKAPEAYPCRASGLVQIACALVECLA